MVDQAKLYTQLDAWNDVWNDVQETMCKKKMQSQATLKMPNTGMILIR